jgi:hypothetical protein
MKVILNQQTTDLLAELQRQFPEGTAMTHIVNVAVREYHKSLSSKDKGINDKRNQSN